MVKSEPKKKLPLGGFFQKFFRKPEKSEKEQRLTVQRSIPYLEMGRDGICRVEEHLYSKTVRFYDINYQLAQNEDKNTIFESWCDFLNYFDASIRFQLSFINHKSDMSEYNKVIQIEPQHDQFDDVRMEYAQMLKQQLAKGNNGLVRTKYITFSIEAKSVREAKPRLERIETDILNNFKVLGVKAYPLNGVERLQIMYETFHQEEQQKFDFSYDRILQSGMTTKDFIAPTSFLFKSGKDFMMGDTYGAASYLNILAPELTDKVLAEFLDMDKNLVVSIHVQSVDQLKAIKLIKGKITDLDRMKIEEQKKAVRSGYDMEIIPSDLATYGGEAKKILDDLQSRNERMFLVTVLFLNTAKTKQELDSAVFQTAGIAQKFNCTLNRLDYLQEQGLMSSLPLANNLVPIKRALTTTSTAIFVPFTTQELFMEGDSLYYGLNAVSNNMIMADRKQLKNPNGLILGTPGSGKSFSAKREITNVFFTTTDDIIVADPEGEYYPLVEALGGQVIHISSTSKDYINPMDINLNYADDDNPLGMKSDFILSLCELIMGARDGMEPEEKSVIDRCLPLVYQKYLNDPKPENMPTLGDLYDCLREQKERQAQRIATALEIYVNGSLRVFNHQTNVELDNRIICFDMQAACDGQCAVVGSIERKRVEKKPPKLYDLTTLQREANRYYGLTASQTLQALQELYEEKLVTYPRTDSQFVTEDMRKTVESLVLALDGAAADVSCVINNSKVTDHHAILPTTQGAKCDMEKLSEAKQKILSLIIWKLVQAVQPPFIYEDVLVTVCCQGRNFTAKYKDVLQPGYTAKPVPFAEPEKDKYVPLPKKMEQGMVLPVVRAEKKQGFTSPPKVYTEDTLLSAMETAGNKEFEKDTEKKGLGTPATRAAILEKLVSSGYVERKGKQMIPTEDGVAAIRNIPDYLKSASMTAEWENDLLRMERGEIKPHDFMQGIHGLLDKMLADLRQIPTVAAAPYYNKVSVGSCPVCGNPVHESKLSFCCADRSCKFALWKESRYLSNMRKTLDKKMAVDLLKKGRTHVKDFYSAKKDKTFAADLVMRVEEGRAQYSLEFPKTPMKTKT